MSDPKKAEQRALVRACKEAVVEVVQTIPMGANQQETLISTIDTLLEIEQAL